MTNFEYFGFSRLNFFIAPLYMEPTSTEMFVFCRRESRTQPNPNDLCRPGPDSNHACWPASPAPSWRWYVWSDPYPLETGLVVVLPGRDAFN